MGKIKKALIKLSKKVTGKDLTNEDSIGDVVNFMADNYQGGGSDTGGPDVEFVISVNSENPSSSQIINYKFDKEQLENKILAGKTINAQCLFRGHYVNDELDFNIIGELKTNFIWLTEDDDVIAEFKFVLNDDNYIISASGTYVIFFGGGSGTPYIMSFTPSN